MSTTSVYTTLPKILPTELQPELPTAANDAMPAAVMAGPDDAPATEVADELVDRAEISNGKSLVKLSKSEALVAALEVEAATTPWSVSTSKDDKAARAFRQRCVTARTSIATWALEMRRPLDSFKKDVIAAERSVVERIKAIEGPVDALITAEEKRKAEEKERAEREAKERKDAIDSAVLEITSRVEACINQPAVFIGETIQWLDDTEVEEADYGDRTLEVRQAVTATRERLVGMKAVAEATEAAAAEAKILSDKVKADAAALKAREDALAKREAIAGRIDALYALPTTLVESTAAEIKAAIEGLAELNPDDYGVRFAEARRAAAGAAVELGDLLAVAEAEERANADAEAAAAPEPEQAPADDVLVLGETMTTVPAPAPIATPQVPSTGSSYVLPTFASNGAVKTAPAPAPAAVSRAVRPTDADLIATLALHYRTHESTVVQWLLDMDLAAASRSFEDAPF